MDKITYSVTITGGSKEDTRKTLTDKLIKAIISGNISLDFKIEDNKIEFIFDVSKTNDVFNKMKLLFALNKLLNMCKADEEKESEQKEEVKDHSKEEHKFDFEWEAHDTKEAEKKKETCSDECVFCDCCSEDCKDGCVICDDCSKNCACCDWDDEDKELDDANESDSCGFCDCCDESCENIENKNCEECEDKCYDDCVCCTLEDEEDECEPECINKCHTCNQPLNKDKNINSANSNLSPVEWIALDYTKLTNLEQMSLKVRSELTKLEEQFYWTKYPLLASLNLNTLGAMSTFLQTIYLDFSKYINKHLIEFDKVIDNNILWELSLHFKDSKDILKLLDQYLLALKIFPECKSLFWDLGIQIPHPVKLKNKLLAYN